MIHLPFRWKIEMPYQTRRRRMAWRHAFINAVATFVCSPAVGFACGVAAGVWLGWR